LSNRSDKSDHYRDTRWERLPVAKELKNNHEFASADFEPRRRRNSTMSTNYYVVDVW